MDACPDRPPLTGVLLVPALLWDAHARGVVVGDLCPGPSSAGGQQEHATKCQRLTTKCCPLTVRRGRPSTGCRDGLWRSVVSLGSVVDRLDTELLIGDSARHRHRDRQRLGDWDVARPSTPGGDDTQVSAPAQRFNAWTRQRAPVRA